MASASSSALQRTGSSCALLWRLAALYHGIAQVHHDPPVLLRDPVFLLRAAVTGRVHGWHICLRLVHELVDQGDVARRLDDAGNWYATHMPYPHQPCTTATHFSRGLICNWAGTRNFLLGFGGAILKDLLVDKKATVQESASDFASTFRFARVVGLGTACFLVGMAVAVPSNLRYQFLTLTNT